MRFKKTDTIPVLSTNIEKIVISLANSRTLPSGLVKRAEIILLASQGNTNQMISAKVGLHYNNVAVWRNRFLRSLPTLCEIEDNTPEKLENEIRSVLSDKKRSGAPTVFTAEQILKIVNLACCNPKDFSYEVSHWSLSLLVKEIKKQGIAAQISEKTVSRFLKMK